MKNESETKPYANKYVMMFIIFWLGVLTGALVLLMVKGSAGTDSQSSILTSPFSNYQYFIPTPPGGISTMPIATNPTIPTPPGGIVSIPTPPGGITP